MTYKFYIDYGSGDVEVHPVGESGINIIVQIHPEQMFRRLIMDGDLVLQNDTAYGYTDYDIISAIDGDTEVTLKIKRSCDNYASIWWQGYFSTYDGEFDDDECTASFKVEVDDAYRPFLESWDKEYNIIGLADTLDVRDELAPEMETLTLLYDTSPGTYPPPDPLSSWWEDKIEQTREAYGVQWEWSAETSPSAGEIWHRYKLDFKYDDNWLEGEDEEVGNYYRDIGYVGYIVDMYYPNSMLLNAIIEYIVNDIDGLTYDSEFLTSPINPVAFNKNDLNNLVIAQKSDYIGVVSDWATIGNITLGKLFDYLKEAFQVYFYIDSGVLYLEHVSFFENGHSYSGSPVIGLDLTAAAYSKYIVQTNKYSFIRDEMYRLEKWGFMEAKNVDFVGVPIEYAQISSNARSQDSSKSHSLSEITTDLLHIQKKSTEISPDGFVLLAGRIPQTDYPADAIMVDWSTYDQARAYTTGSLGYNPTLKIHGLIGISDLGLHFAGARTIPLTIKRNTTIRIEYQLTLNSGTAPVVALKSEGTQSNAEYYGKLISEEVRFENGTGVIELKSFTDEAVYLNVYNKKESTDYTLYLEIQVKHVTVKTEIGILSNERIKNEPLSLARLQQNYWRNYRPVRDGILNNSAVVFISTKKNKLQKAFFIFQCCDAIDYDELVKTDLGIGAIHKAVYSLGDGTLELEIVYDSYAVAATGIGAMEIEDTFIIG